MDKTSTTVYLAGIEFHLTSERSEEYMQKLAIFVNGRINEFQSKTPSLSTYECALLAMYQLADDFHERKDAYDKLESRIDTLRTGRAREQKARSEVPVKRPFE